MNLCCRNQALNLAVGRVGGIEVILEALQYFKGEIIVQKYGCHALMNLMWECRQNVDIFVRQKGVPIVIETMKRFSADGELQKYGCGIVGHICVLQPEYHRHVIDAGGLVAVASVVQKYLHIADVHHRAQRAMTLMMNEERLGSYVSGKK
jgi:hypothetical protein